ncbi:hypothetical protein LINPERHAP1_LOCUS35097 [Linum perenne]
MGSEVKVPSLSAAAGRPTSMGFWVLNATVRSLIFTVAG